MSIDHVHYIIDQLLTFVVAQFAKRDTAPEVRVVIRVTAGAPKRALARYFNGKRWAFASQNFVPST